MKKTILSLAGVSLVLLGASAFNVYGHFSNKHKTHFAGAYYWGFNVKEMCRNSESYRGSNYVVAVLRKNNGQHTIGNTEKTFYTWYMNK
jgi:hypothetical protein